MNQIIFIFCTAAFLHRLSGMNGLIKTMLIKCTVPESNLLPPEDGSFFEKLESIQTNLFIFLGIERLRTNDLTEPLTQHSLVMKNYSNFEAAKSELIALGNKLKPMFFSKKGEKRKEFELFFTLTKNNTARELSELYACVLDSFLAIFYNFIRNKAKEFKFEIKKEFVLALPIILYKINVLFYLELHGIIDINNFISHQKMYLLEQRKEINFWTDNEYLENNFIKIIKLLVLINDCQSLSFTGLNQVQSFNTIQIGLKVLKDSKFTSEKIDKFLVEIFNNLVVKYLEIDGLRIMDSKNIEMLFFYNKEEKNLEVSNHENLTISKYNNGNIPSCNDITGIFTISQEPLEIISGLFNLFNKECRQKIVILICNLRILSCHIVECVKTQELCLMAYNYNVDFYIEAFSKAIINFAAKRIVTYLKNVNINYIENIFIEKLIYLANLCQFYKNWEMEEAKEFVQAFIDFFLIIKSRFA